MYICVAVLDTSLISWINDSETAGFNDCSRVQIFSIRSATCENSHQLLKGSQGNILDTNLDIELVSESDIVCNSVEACMTELIPGKEVDVVGSVPSIVRTLVTA